MGEQHKGILYLVPTPIGNMEDITLRALRVLREVAAVAAEDTRHTGLLLKHFSIDKPLISYHEHNKDDKGPYLIDMLLSGQDIACVSDAGMPAISDPGEDLVEKALERGITVVPLPGANAALTALIASGLPAKQFTFFGFLPKRDRHRRDMLQHIAKQEGTLLFYEAPHRIKEVLTDMYEAFGNRPVTVAREVTKKFETFLRTNLESLITDPEQITCKGEFVLIIGGAEYGTASQDEPADVSYEEAVRLLTEQGIQKKEAIRQVAKRYGVSRREVYNIVER